ncbi:MAG TPA: hypothetical protein VFQ78_15620 [Candidatus Udaeobacter sp.]|nr:hypothetical protein [Candidatus Udaeobacter sp.]
MPKFCRNCWITNIVGTALTTDVLIVFHFAVARRMQINTSVMVFLFGVRQTQRTNTPIKHN